MRGRGSQLSPWSSFAVSLTNGAHERFFVSVHLHATGELSWFNLATMLSDFIEAHRDAVGFALGDYNVCLSPEDVLDLRALQPLCAPGGRARHHQLCFGHLSEVVVGPSRQGNDGLLAALDRAITTLIPSLLETLDVQARALGFPWHPPAGSDHCPFLLHVGAQRSNDGFPRWVASRGHWDTIFRHQIAEHVVPNVDWKARYAQLKDAIAAAAAETQRFSSASAATTPEAQLAVALRSLYALFAGDLVRASSLAATSGLPSPSSVSKTKMFGAARSSSTSASRCGSTLSPSGPYIIVTNFNSTCQGGATI